METALAPAVASETALASPTMPGLRLPALSLCKRELVRFLRQPQPDHRSPATPIVFWLLIGREWVIVSKARAVSTEHGGSTCNFFSPEPC